MVTQLSWYKPRGYIHFDAPVSRRDAEALVSDPTGIAQRSFWPLISFQIRERRWKHKGTNPTYKTRPIAYASHVDSHIYSYYAWLLSGPYESLLRSSGLEDVVLAYRKILAKPGVSSRGKSNIHFAAEAFAAVPALGSCDATVVDIDKFFDTIPHDTLKQNWCRLLNSSSLPPDHYAVFKSVTRFARVPLPAVRAALGIGRRRFLNLRSIAMDSMTFHQKVRQAGIIEINDDGKGIPQGLPISGLLANLAMFQVDEAMIAAARALGASYRRYSDDILILGPPGISQDLLRHLAGLLEPLDLHFQDDKTRRSHFRRDVAGSIEVDKPLRYLGFEFDGRRVLVRPQTLAKFGKRMKRAVRRAYRAAKKGVMKGGAPVLRKRKLYAMYSHLKPHPETPEARRPRGSFLKYARIAAETMHLHGSEHEFEQQIRRQLRRHWNLLQNQILHAEARLAKLAAKRAGTDRKAEKGV